MRRHVPPKEPTPEQLHAVAAKLRELGYEPGAAAAGFLHMAKSAERCEQFLAEGLSPQERRARETELERRRQASKPYVMFQGVKTAALAVAAVRMTSAPSRAAAARSSSRARSVGFWSRVETR
jgi:hypothetical protein